MLVSRWSEPGWEPLYEANRKGEQLSEGTSCPRGWAGPLASCFSTLCAPRSKTKPASPSSLRNNTCHTHIALICFCPPLALFSFFLVLSPSYHLPVFLLHCPSPLSSPVLLQLTFSSVLFPLLISILYFTLLPPSYSFLFFLHIFFTLMIFAIFFLCFIHTFFLPLLPP